MCFPVFSSHVSVSLKFVNKVSARQVSATDGQSHQAAIFSSVKHSSYLSQRLLVLITNVKSAMKSDNNRDIDFCQVDLDWVF